MATLDTVRADEAAGRLAKDARAEPFADFYARNFRDVVGLAYSLTGSWVAAEDIAQEAFVRAYRGWRRGAGYRRPDSWVRTVVANLATSRGRRLAAEARAVARLRARPPLPADDDLPEDADAFWSAVRSLPRRQAQAVALRYHADLSVDEVAESMGCAPGTAKAHLHGARQALADALGVSEEDERDD